MLLRHFPEYFRSIPWQNTGMAIGWSPIREKIYRKLQTKAKGLAKRLNKAGFSNTGDKEFSSYAQWIRQNPAKSFFEELLCNPDALYREFIPALEVMSIFNRHMLGENMSKQLCRYLTIELWLQQVYEGKYREGME